MSLRSLRLILWSLVGIVLVAATVLFVWRQVEGRPVVPRQLGGEFALQMASGGTFTDEDLKGTPTLMFFGYTFCPDVCPTTLFESTTWRNELDLTPDDLRIVFVSVDPERDTPELIANYLTSFPGEVVGLTGDQSAIDQISTAYGVVAEKVDAEGASDYLVNHTATVFMLDENGQFAGTIAYGENRDTALAKLRRLTGTDAG
ncbi:SCO family protein [Cucumibacter marinus]|uniref:SCO family protein n=1 Tax=Cucumibacter marinus TaxID=1121252 RepID=UPI00041211F9|nr:SCO family protein [Cucumibacter marinus]